jgi:hypothetical protein
MVQAKRKARKRTVKDIDDRAKQKPAVNGVILTFGQVSARWRSGLRSCSTKKKYTFERTSGAQDEQWIEKAVEAVERKCMFSPWEKSHWGRRHFVWSDVETYDAKFDRSIDDGWSIEMEKKKRTVHSDDVWRSFRKRDLIVLREMSEREKGVGCGVKSWHWATPTWRTAGKSTAWWQAKRKARKRAVTDIDDSVKQKPAVNGVILTFRQVSARWRSGLRSCSTKKKKKYTFERTSGAQGEQWIEKAVEAVERKCMFSPWEKATELADILCGATLKLTTQSSIDWSIDGDDREEEADRPQWRRLKEFREARLDSVARNVRERNGVGCGVKSQHWATPTWRTAGESTAWCKRRGRQESVQSQTLMTE